MVAGWANLQKVQIWIAVPLLHGFQARFCVVSSIKFSQWQIVQKTKLPIRQNRRKIHVRLERNDRAKESGLDTECSYQRNFPMGNHALVSVVSYWTDPMGAPD